MFQPLSNSEISHGTSTLPHIQRCQLGLDFSVFTRLNIYKGPGGRETRAFNMVSTFKGNFIHKEGLIPRLHWMIVSSISFHLTDSLSIALVSYRVMCTTHILWYRKGLSCGLIISNQRLRTLGNHLAFYVDMVQPQNSSISFNTSNSVKSIHYQGVLSLPQGY